MKIKKQNQKIINNINKKIVDKKLFNLIEILKKKLMFYI